MTADFDPYKVLGVDHAAEPEIVAAAYRALARLHHPDVSRNEDAEPRMARINAAWTILRDPGRRAAYDREHSIEDGLGGAGRGENPLRALHQRAKAGTSAPDAPGVRTSSHTSFTPSGRPGEAIWRRGPSGEGAAGPPPGRPSGSVLSFGRHIGWSLGEVVRVDPGYLQWLAARGEGAPYRAEIATLLAPLLRTADGRGFLHPEADASPRAPPWRAHMPRPSDLRTNGCAVGCTVRIGRRLLRTRLGRATNGTQIRRPGARRNRSSSDPTKGGDRSRIARGTGAERSPD
jgi:curved DNA-binding protein CbpA